jgi:hypothetical protein
MASIGTASTAAARRIATEGRIACSCSFGRVRPVGQASRSPPAGRIAPAARPARCRTAPSGGIRSGVTGGKSGSPKATCRPAPAQYSPVAGEPVAAGVAVGAWRPSRSPGRAGSGWCRGGPRISSEVEPQARHARTRERASPAGSRRGDQTRASLWRERWLSGQPALGAVPPALIVADSSAPLGTPQRCSTSA